MEIRLLPWMRWPELASFGVIVALLLTLALPAAALADPPFKASLTETFAPAACPAGAAADALCANASGSGNATGMGKTTEMSLGTVYLAQWSPTTGCAPEVAATTLTAANGDQLFLTTTGTFCQTDPTTAVDSGAFQVTGGSGRFTGASGSGTYVTTASMGGGTSVTTMTGSLTLHD